MKKKIKVIIAILLTLIGITLMINHLFDEEENINVVEQNILQKEESNTISNDITTTTTKSSNNVVKTTTTTKKHNYNDYQLYAKKISNYNDTQMTCLINLWQKESEWNPNKVNKLSGACGIPQAKPCNKIINQQGSNDWKAQIRWGINYINYRYKNPCNAWKFWKNNYWY